MFDENYSVCTAILIPCQGYSNKYKVISLMSWYSKDHTEVSIQFYLLKSINFLNQIICNYRLYAYKNSKLILKKLVKTMKCRKIDLIILTT